MKAYNSNYKIIYKRKNETFEKIKNLNKEKDKKEINQLFKKIDVYMENIRSIRIKRNENRKQLLDITFEYLINCPFSKKEDNLQDILGVVPDKNGVSELNKYSYIADCQEYFITAPAPKPSSKYKSINEFIEDHDFIY